MAEAKEDTQYELDVSDSPETEVEIPEKEVATSTENEVETVVEEAPAVEGHLLPEVGGCDMFVQLRQEFHLPEELQHAGPSRSHLS